MEKTICPLPCLKSVLNSTKTVCVPEKISATLATRRWEYFANDYLSTDFAISFVMKTQIQNMWESANKFLCWEAKQNEVFSLKFFSKQSVKTRWRGFFALCNADFEIPEMPRNSCGGQKMAPHENKWSPPDGAHE